MQTLHREGNCIAGLAGGNCFICHLPDSVLPFKSPVQIDSLAYFYKMLDTWLLRVWWEIEEVKIGGLYLLHRAVVQIK